MKKIIKINENLCIEEINKIRRTITSIIDNDKKTILADIKTNDYFWSKTIFNDHYIVVYSRGCMINQIPLTVEAAYDIKEKRILDLSNLKLKVLLEYMLIHKIGFDLTEVLTFINTEDLKIIEDDLKGDIKRRLTSANNDITDEEVIDYILSNYPILSNYRNLKGPLTVIEYKNIEEEIGQDILKFHIMPQSLKFVENNNISNARKDNPNYNEIYTSEYEHTQKVLRLKKSNK